MNLFELPFKNTNMPDWNCFNIPRSDGRWVTVLKPVRANNKGYFIYVFRRPWEPWEVSRYQTALATYPDLDPIAAQAVLYDLLNNLEVTDAAE